MTPPTDTDRAPWEIEIRDRGSQRPQAPREPQRRRSAPGGLVALVVLGIACVAATLALLGWLTGDGDQDTAQEAPTPTTSPITFAPRLDAPAAAAPATTTTTTVATTAITTAPPATTGAAPPATTTAPATAAPASGTGSVPALSSSFGGGWVAMLTSVPYSSGTSRLEAAFAEVRRVAPDAAAARGEDWSSLGDGYWALVRTGFGSAGEVRSFCAGIDTSRVDCAARELRRG